MGAEPVQKHQQRHQLHCQWDRHHCVHKCRWCWTPPKLSTQSQEKSRGLWGVCRRTLTRSPVPIPIIALVVSVGDCGARHIAGSVPTSVRDEGAQGHPEAEVEQRPNKRSTYVKEGFIQRAGP